MVIGGGLTSYGYLMQPIQAYLSWKQEKDSILTIQYVSTYIDGFTAKVEHLDSLDSAIMVKLSDMEKKDSTTKAVGVRALPNGIFSFRDEWTNTSEAYRYTTRDSITNWTNVYLRYRDRNDGIEYHVLLKGYYDN